MRQYFDLPVYDPYPGLQSSKRVFPKEHLYQLEVVKSCANFHAVRS